MVLFNYSTKELTAKVVYYGPGLCGKTTNLQWIHEKLPIKHKGKMLSLATETDRTLFFDFLPIELGTIRGMRTRIQLYTVPGQVFYNATRRMVLKGADCIVFVVDSQEPMLEANAESLENLRENLEINELDPDETPLVIQYNKRDLPNALPIGVLNQRLNPRGVPHFEAVALKGQGVEETLKGVTALVFRSLASKYGGNEAAARPAAAAAPQAAPANPPAPITAPPTPPAAARQTPAPRPPLNLQASEEPAEELLSSLQLEPASDVGDDFDLGLPPIGPSATPPVLEELSLEEELLPQVEELALEPERPQAPAPPSNQAGKTTLVHSADEAAEMRRRIEQTVSHEQETRAETIDDLELEPESALHEPEPVANPPLEAFELALPAHETLDQPMEPASDIVIESEPMEDLVEELAPPPPAPAALRSVLDTLPPFGDQSAGRQAALAVAGPPAVVQTAPLTVELPAHGGPLELAIPVEVRLEDGTARINIQLRLTLDLKLTK